MNIRCPHCQTLFRVDPARVPARGIRARCARCGGTFQIAGTSAPDGAASPQQAAPRPVGPSGGHAPRGDAQPHGFASAPGPHRDAGSGEPGGYPGGGTQPGPPQHDAPARPAEPDRPAPGGFAASGSGATAPAAGQAQPGGAAGGAPQRPVFGSRDPNARAQRIARALVSDIVAYHPERRDQALGAGTLRAEFRDEIMKSWDEYVAQVGQETAKSTPYFRQALNDILARGEAVF